MGCVLPKLDSPNRTRGRHEEMKDHNRYVRGSKLENEFATAKNVGKVVRLQAPEGKLPSIVDLGGRVELKKVSNNGGSNANRTANNNNSNKKRKKKKIGGDDQVVNGWPQWLVDNIPQDVLAGLIPRSADSYEKLAKVSI